MATWPPACFWLRLVVAEWAASSPGLLPAPGARRCSPLCMAFEKRRMLTGQRWTFYGLAVAMIWGGAFLAFTAYAKPLQRSRGANSDSIETLLQTAESPTAAAEWEAKPQVDLDARFPPTLDWRLDPEWVAIGGENTERMSL